MNDLQLITAIRARDEAAIDFAIRRYAKLMWSIAGTVLKDIAPREDIEECVADVFVHLWQYPEKFDPQRGKLKVWLSLIARSKALDRCRLLLRQSAVPLDEALLADSADPAGQILRDEAHRALRAALASLEADDQDLLLRRFCCRQKPKEIAQALDCPVKQVENRLYRLKQRLRDQLTNEIGGIFL